MTHLISSKLFFPCKKKSFPSLYGNITINLSAYNVFWGEHYLYPFTDIYKHPAFLCHPLRLALRVESRSGQAPTEAEERGEVEGSTIFAVGSLFKEKAHGT